MFITVFGHAVAPSAPVRAVEAVDLRRYVGDWFEIARFPNRLQQRWASDRPSGTP